MRILVLLACLLVTACGLARTEPQTLTGRLFGPPDMTSLVIQFDNLTNGPIDFGRGEAYPGFIQSIGFDGRQAVNGAVEFGAPRGPTAVRGLFALFSHSIGPDGLGIGTVIAAQASGQITLTARFENGRAAPVRVADLEGTRLRWTFQADDSAPNGGVTGPFLTKTGVLRANAKPLVGLTLFEDR
ncbi:MAG: hypothetical protein AAF871_03485 [Pseudomonadota bacterium]